MTLGNRYWLPYPVGSIALVAPQVGLRPEAFSSWSS